MNTFAEVVEALRSRRRWLVTSHARPDGDAVGSVLASVEILRAMGGQAQGWLSDPVPFLYRKLPGASALRSGPVDAIPYDAALILECNSLERTELDGLQHLFTVNIDHHETATEYADVNYSVPSASAAGELVYLVAKAAGVHITPEIATCLYTAVLTDTGSFCFSSTTAETFAFAREMVLAGADPGGIAQQVYFSNPARKMHLLGRALANLHCEGPISWMYISLEDMNSTGATSEDCEGLVNWALGIDGIEATAFLREMAGSRPGQPNSGFHHRTPTAGAPGTPGFPVARYRVSLRSKGRIDVSQISRSFGGGGHTCASGHAMDGPLEAACKKVLTALRAAFAEPAQKL